MQPNQLDNQPASTPTPIPAPSEAPSGASNPDLAKALEETPATEPTAPNQPAPATEPKPKSSKLPWACATIAIILALAGIGFGVYTFMDSNNKSNTISTLEAKVKTLNETIDKVEEGTIETPTESGEIANQASIVNTEEYVYIGEWGIKIKIPDGLSYVSYEMRSEISDGNNQNSADYTTLSVIGVPTEADKTNAKELYRLSRSAEFISTCYLASVGRMSKEETENHGTIIFSDDDYDYVFYNGQTSCVNSDTGSNITEIEQKARLLVNDMLSKKDNYSKF